MTTDLKDRGVGGGRIPDTPVGHLVRAHLDALNSGDPGTIRSHVTERCLVPPHLPADVSINAHIGSVLGFYHATAGLGYAFHSMLGADDSEVRAALYSRLTESWVAMRIPVAGPPPHKISGFVEIKPTPPPAGAQPTLKLGEDGILERLERCLDALVRGEVFSGAVHVARGADPLLAKAYGLASKSYQVPNRVDTKFNIASTGKMFTGVAIAQLAEQGVLALTDPVGEYLGADWIEPEIGHKVQIQHLLTHTSGLGDYFGTVHSQSGFTLYRGIDDYKPLVAAQPLSFEPGTRWSYSNTGMLLLGAVIERVTGRSYFDVVRERIYEPAGMVDTNAYDKDLPLQNRATGYTQEYTDEGATSRLSLLSRVMKGGPSGGSYSTVIDLWRFGLALREHRLLGPEYTEMVLTAKPEIGSPFYGYGFFVEQGETGRNVGHGGDGTGINARFRMYLDLGYSIAILANYGPPAATIVLHIFHALVDAR